MRLKILLIIGIVALCMVSVTAVNEYQIASDNNFATVESNDTVELTDDGELLDADDEQYIPDDIIESGELITVEVVNETDESDRDDPNTVYFDEPNNDSEFVDYDFSFMDEW